MPRRRAGTLLPLEEKILEVGMRLDAEGRPEFYGFALAEELRSIGTSDRLLGHGTLYKALARLEQGGVLTSRWEDVDASEAGRPRRRLYRVTGSAAAALTESRALSEAPARTRRWAVS
jgi:PadR family transcriptional regulator, regulatory protein PadR